MKQIILFLVCMRLLTACSTTQQTDETYFDFFPRETDLPGWEFSRKPSEYKGNRLQQLNKAYISYRATRGYRAVYRSISGENLNLLVDIVTFGNVIDCFGSFSYQAMEFTGAVLSEEQLVAHSMGGVARSGRFVVRIQYSGNPPETDPADNAFLLKLILDNLPDNTEDESLPGYLYLLDTGKSLRGVTFYRGNYYGVKHLSDIVIKNIRLQGEGNSPVFYSVHNDHNNALKKYSRLLKAHVDEMVVTQVRAVPTAFIKRNNMYIYISYYKNFFFGLVSDKSIGPASPLLTDLLTRLKEIR